MMNIAMMPLKKNVGSSPNHDDWELRNCPVCGRECYYQRRNAAALMSIAPDTVFVCTECALKGQTRK